MNRYINGHATLFGVAYCFCWDGVNKHLDAVQATDKEYVAGPEAPFEVRAAIQYILEGDNLPSQLAHFQAFTTTAQQSVPVWLRIRHELAIATRLITDVIAQGGLISVNDGEETVLVRSNSLEAVLAAMFSTDEDYLYVTMPNSTKRAGGFQFIYGNDGWDVIADWSWSNEVKDCEATMQKYEAGAGMLASAIENKYGA